MSQQPIEEYRSSPRETSSKAIAALVMSLLGISGVCAPLGIVGIILGNQAQEEIRAARGQLDGDGLAKAGVILGWISVGLLVLAILVFCLMFGLFGAIGAAGASAGAGGPPVGP